MSCLSVHGSSGEKRKIFLHRIATSILYDLNLRLEVK